MEEAKVIDAEVKEVKETEEKKEAPAEVKVEEKKETKLQKAGRYAKKGLKIAGGVALGIGIYALGEHSGAAKALKKIAAKAADSDTPDSDPMDSNDDNTEV